MIPVRKDAYQLFHEGTLTLSEIEMNGIRIDVDYLDRKCQEMDAASIQLKSDIMRHPEMKRWKSKYGVKFNMESGDQLGDILFKEMKFTPKKYTETGKPCVDEESIESLKDENAFIRDLVKLRKYSKATGTYLRNIRMETVNGFLHPMFSLNIPVTYRSSSQYINFQNIPVRDEWMRDLIRSAFIPRRGNRIMELDFKGAEVSVSTCYNKDPKLITYVSDDSTDMHGDTAVEIFRPSLNEQYRIKKEKPKLFKLMRYLAKNKFVFPQFYGDWYKSCAEALWESIEKDSELRNWMITVGFRDYAQFEKHIQDVEYDFWNRRFPVYTQWKKDHFNQYLKRGYFDTLTGFRCQGIMGRNQVINYPVQGSAFHCLLWALIQLQKRIKGWKSKIIGQIHDSIVIDVHPDEFEAVLELVNRIITQELPKHWDWIIVPLRIEAEATEIDQSWKTKKEIKL